jgi:hypothetical protein
LEWPIKCVLPAPLGAALPISFAQTNTLGLPFEYGKPALLQAPRQSINESTSLELKTVLISVYLSPCLNHICTENKSLKCAAPPHPYFSIREILDSVLELA